MKRAGSVCGVKPTGTMIVVEMLTAQECAGTILSLGNSKPTAPQGYILEIGPALKPEEWGIKVGDRVLLQGSYVPVPWNRVSDREVGIVMAHDIKCVLQEDTESCCSGGVCKVG